MFFVIEFIVRGVLWALGIIFKILILVIKVLFNVGQLYQYEKQCPYCGHPMRTAMGQQERCQNCGSVGGRPPAGRRNTRQAGFDLMSGHSGPAQSELYGSAWCYNCRWSSSSRNAERLGVRHRDNTGHLVIFE